MEPTAPVTGDERGSPSFIARVWEEIRFAGPVEFAGLLAIALALCLLIGSPYLAQRRRHLLLLLGAAVCLGVAGYALFDSRYVLLNLGMRDAEQVRADCERLRAASRAGGGEELVFSAAAQSDFPASFKRLGATSAYASSDSVYINLGFDGYLYCPQLSTMFVEDGQVRELGLFMSGKRGRRTLYHDFYYFRPWSE